ncbi:ATP-binding cassette domain-containing protein [Tepidimicrobium xylanilyticum]|nr:ATP-binding cassette domain-containing protein [Tepidimicrobium xylanilyticum]
MDRVYFKINEGKLVGYIGPNGSGKSTTIKNIKWNSYAGLGKISSIR